MNDTKLFNRKTFAVRAIQVTDENIEWVAKWINSSFQVHTSPDGRKYVLVPYVASDGRTVLAEAYVDSWVTRNDAGNYKHYTDKKFRAIFEEAPSFKPKGYAVEYSDDGKGNRTYYHTVIDPGRNTIFNGPPEKVVEWLLAKDQPERVRSQRAVQRQFFQVYNERTLRTLEAKDYLKEQFTQMMGAALMGVLQENEEQIANGRFTSELETAAKVVKASHKIWEMFE